MVLASLGGLPRSRLDGPGEDDDGQGPQNDGLPGVATFWTKIPPITPRANIPGIPTIRAARPSRRETFCDPNGAASQLDGGKTRLDRLLVVRHIRC
jgi:hypothetical protein